jgi:hypothetical protein
MLCAAIWWFVWLYNSNNTCMFEKCELHHWVEVLDLCDTILERECNKEHENTGQSLSARPRALVYVVSNTHRLKPHSVSHSKFITNVN